MVLFFLVPHFPRYSSESELTDLFPFGLKFKLKPLLLWIWAELTLRVCFFCSLCSQFRYKTRVYKQTNLDEKQLAKLHTKVTRTLL